MISVAVVQKIRHAMKQMIDAKSYCPNIYGQEHIDKAIVACEEAHEMLIGYKHEGEEKV